MKVASEGVGINKDKNVIEKNRKKLDKITEDLIQLVRKRDKLVLEIGKAKKRLGIEVLDIKRESKILEGARAKAQALGVDEHLIEGILKLLIEDSRRKQE